MNGAEMENFLMDLRSFVQNIQNLSQELDSLKPFFQQINGYAQFNYGPSLTQDCSNLLCSINNLESGMRETKNLFDQLNEN